MCTSTTSILFLLLQIPILASTTVAQESHSFTVLTEASFLHFYSSMIIKTLQMLLMLGKACRRLCEPLHTIDHLQVHQQAAPWSDNIHAIGAKRSWLPIHTGKPWSLRGNKIAMEYPSDEDDGGMNKNFLCTAKHTASSQRKILCIQYEE